MAKNNRKSSKAGLRNTESLSRLLSGVSRDILETVVKRAAPDMVLVPIAQLQQAGIAWLTIVESALDQDRSSPNLILRRDRLADAAELTMHMLEEAGAKI